MDKVFECPKCEGSGYMLKGDGSRCLMCGGKGKVEDGGPSAVRGDKGLRETGYIGASGYKVVINLRTHRDN